jgi:hypothetical protein
MRSVALALSLILVACTGGSGSIQDATTDATLDADDEVPCLFCADAEDDRPLAIRVEGKLVQVCGQVTECHGSGWGGMSISPADPLKTLVNVPSTEAPSMMRVAPGDPIHSYVYLKLRCDGGIVGGCMPGGGNTGDPVLAQLFYDWIEAGAPDH